jgi:hypothetical protein
MDDRIREFKHNPFQLLYYEAPAGKIKREDKNRCARMYIDILAKERQSKALVIIEIKNDTEDLNTLIFVKSLNMKKIKMQVVLYTRRIKKFKAARRIPSRIYRC